MKSKFLCEALYRIVMEVFYLLRLIDRPFMWGSVNSLELYNTEFLVRKLI